MTMFLLLQTQKVVVALGDHLGIRCHACMGGMNVREDQARLEQGMQIVVGTPGQPRSRTHTTCG